MEWCGHVGTVRSHNVRQRLLRNRLSRSQSIIPRDVTDWVSAFCNSYSTCRPFSWSGARHASQYGDDRGTVVLPLRSWQSSRDHRTAFYRFVVHFKLQIYILYAFFDVVHLRPPLFLLARQHVKLFGSHGNSFHLYYAIWMNNKSER